MHAETLASDHGAIRWVVPEANLPTGRVVTAPGRLGDLLTTGVLSGVTTEPHGVVMRLGPDRDWRKEGDQIRGALTVALEDLGGWVVVPDRDGVLREIVDDVLAGPAGDYVRSHGGLVTVVGVADGAVDIEFSGACSGCPASGVTLHTRLETAVRERYPDLTGLRDVSPPRTSRKLVLWPRLGVGS